MFCYEFLLHHLRVNPFALCTYQSNHHPFLHPRANTFLLFVCLIAKVFQITSNEFESLNKNQVLDELANEIFSLNKNEISEIVETTLAHHIILLDNIIDEKQLLLDDVSNEIKNILTNVQTDNYFNDLKTLVDQQILDGFSIQEIANSNDLSITNLNKITLGDDNQDDQIEY